MATRFRIPQGRMDALTPIGQSLNNLANLFVQMPTADERAYQRARTDAATTEADINRNRLRAASTIQDVFTRGLTPPPGVDPTAHYRTILPEIARVAAEAGQYGQIGDIGRVLATAIAGSTPQLQTTAMLGAGQGMSATPMGFAADQQRQRDENAARVGASLASSRYATDRAAATQRAIADRTPVHIVQTGPDGQPRTINMSAGEYYAIPPDQRPALAAAPTAAAPRAPDNYLLPDGSSVLSADGQSYRHPETGAVTPMPSNARRVGLQVQATSPDGLTPTQSGNQAQSALAMERLQRLMRDAVTLGGNPANFGATGAFRGLVQDAIQQGNAAMQYFSPEWAQRYRATADQLGGAAGVGSFDPALPQLNMVLNMLPYMAAEAVAGQSGRSVSNEDVRRWERIVGSGGPVANQAEFMARMRQLDQMLTQEINTVRARRPGQAPVPSMLDQGAGGAPAAPGAAAPAAPGGAAAPPVARWGRDANGRPVRLQ